MIDSFLFFSFTFLFFSFGFVLLSLPRFWALFVFAILVRLTGWSPLCEHYNWYVKSTTGRHSPHKTSDFFRLTDTTEYEVYERWLPLSLLCSLSLSSHSAHAKGNRQTDFGGSVSSTRMYVRRPLAIKVDKPTTAVIAFLALKLSLLYDDVGNFLLCRGVLVVVLLSAMSLMIPVLY